MNENGMFLHLEQTVKVEDLDNIYFEFSEDPQLFVDFVLGQLDEASGFFWVENSVGREAENLLRQALKRRKKERSDE